MGENAIITVDHVSMKFNLASEKFDNIKEYIIKTLLPRSLTHSPRAATSSFDIFTFVKYVHKR